MKTKETEELAFFGFPIEHFTDQSAQWLLKDKENVRGLLEIVAEHLGVQLTSVNLHILMRVSFQTTFGIKNRMSFIACRFAENRKRMRPLFISSLNTDSTLRQHRLVRV